MKQSKKRHMTGQLSGKMLSSFALFFLFKCSRRPLGVWQQRAEAKKLVFGLESKLNSFTCV